MASASSTSQSQQLGRVLGGLVYFIAVTFFVLLAVIKVPWELLVPELFPGAVQQGLMAPTMSWGSTFILAATLTTASSILRYIRFPGPETESDRLLSAKLNAIVKHMGIDLSAAINAELAALVKKDRKIEAIALYRSYAEVGLAEAKAHVEALERGGA